MRRLYHGLRALLLRRAMDQDLDGGVAVGIAVAIAVRRYLQALLVGVTPLDPASFITAAALLIVVAFFACYLPTRRATLVDHMIALRCE
jgi:hypothetical protein